MYKIHCCCDVCGKKLETYTVNTSLGDIEEFDTHPTQVISTRNVLPHLCETCSLKLDNLFLAFKLENSVSKKK